MAEANKALENMPQPVCIILTDGRFNKYKVIPYVAEAKAKGIAVVIIIIDGIILISK